MACLNLADLWMLWWMNGDVADGVNADAKRRFPAALERNIS